MWKTRNIEARGSRTHLDDGHQTDPGLLCDTLPSLSQSAPIFCRKHTDETGFLLKMDPHSGRLRGSDVTRHLRRYKLKKKKNLFKTDTSCSVGPLCASSHSSSNAERSAFESTAMATAMAADTALDNADVKAATMAADGSSSAEDIAAWKRGRGGGEEEADNSVLY